MQSRAGVDVVVPDLDTEFEEYLAQRLDWLSRCAFLLTRDAEAARDLAQDAVVRAWSSRQRVAGAADRDAYVARIMLNVLRSQRRKRTLTVVDAPASMESAYSTFGAGAEDRMIVMDALRELPQRQRAAVVLRYWADFSDRQIAEVLRCRPGTVRSLLSRSLRNLRLLLEDE